MYIDQFWAGVLTTLVTEVAVVLGFYSMQLGEAENEAAEEVNPVAKEAVSAAHLNAGEWMLVEETEFYLKLSNKTTNKRKIVDKFKRARR